MTITSEIIRLWSNDPAACALCPAEKVFVGRVPDKYLAADGKERKLNPPFVSIRPPDGSSPGGTSNAIGREITLQLSFCADRRADAEKMRDFARGFFENCELADPSPLERFQSISYIDEGELPDEDGIYELFLRFNVETAFERPTRRKV